MPSRRLKVVTEHIVGCGTAAETSLDAGCFPLAVEPHGSVSSTSNAALRSALAEAVGREDFRRAADLQQSLDVLVGPGLTIEDALRPANADERACFFLEHGVSRRRTCSLVGRHLSGPLTSP